MAELRLTKTAMRQGVWHGVLTPDTPEPPAIAVRHEGREVPDIGLERDAEAGHWLLSIPIPPEAIADGVQTLLILDAGTQAKLGQVTLIAGEALADDIRAEVDLLRAELDMLKGAFRRHCREG